MLLKDYYTTLEVGPTATEQEIKKSFRRLVLRFHPDKNNGNAVAEARFREIREAYEILSDPQQREEYNYKRWYNRSLGKQFQAVPLTPQGVLNECERLYNYVQALTSSRVDYDALSYHIRKNLLSEGNVRLLQQFNDRTVNREITRKIVRCCRSLPWRYIEPVAALLRQVAGSDMELVGEVDAFVETHQAGRRWNSYRVVIVIVVTALLCGLIYLLGH
jgi:curved DNA-binding protein CbpA